MQRNLLFAGIFILALILLSKNCLAETQVEDTNENSNKLIVFIAVVYIVLFLGIFGYFYEIKPSINDEISKIASDEEMDPKPSKKIFHSSKFDDDEFKHPLLYECPDCNKQFVSTSAREKVKCPFCKVKDL